MSSTIDVVIPVRNGASTLRRAVSSVLTQTRPPDRILIVDDGSTDGSAGVAQGLPRVDVITTPPLGVSHARNTGIRASGAAFIAFLDCDDFWLPDKLRQQLAVFQRQPDMVAVNTAFVSVDTNGQVLRGGTSPVSLRRNAHRQLLKLFHRGGGGSSTMMAKRLALLAVGCFDERLAYGEDRDMWLRLSEAGPFGYCAAVLAGIVENPASVTRRSLDDPAIRAEMLMQNLEVMEKWAGRADLPWMFYVNCCSEILIQAVRNQFSLRDLRAMRRQLHERVPRIAARVAASDASFLRRLAASGVLNGPTVLRRYVRYRRRRLAMSRRSHHDVRSEAA